MHVPMEYKKLVRNFLILGGESLHCYDGLLGAFIAFLMHCTEASKKLSN